MSQLVTESPHYFNSSHNALKSRLPPPPFLDRGFHPVTLLPEHIVHKAELVHQPLASGGFHFRFLDCPAFILPTPLLLGRGIGGLRMETEGA